MKTKDLSQLRGFARDLTAALEVGVGLGGIGVVLPRAQRSTSRPQHLVSLNWWEGSDWSGEASDLGRGRKWGKQE